MFCSQSYLGLIPPVCKHKVFILCLDRAQFTSLANTDEEFNFQRAKQSFVFPFSLISYHCCLSLYASTLFFFECMIFSSLNFSVSLFLSVYLYFCLCRSFSFSLCLSLSLSFTLSLFLFLPISQKWSSCLSLSFYFSPPSLIFSFFLPLLAALLLCLFSSLSQKQDRQPNITH